MLEDAKKYVETCQVCQRDKPRTQALLGLLKPLPIPAGPGQSVSMDFMDTLVTSRGGKRHIFVIIDRFTKYARLIAMPETARTEHVIKLFMDNWMRDFGLPKSIVSDRDVRFTTVFTVLMYGSPLAVMGTVIKTLSVEFMPFSLSLLGFVCSSTWAAYGIYVQDLWIILPNLLGSLLGLMQLILYAYIVRLNRTGAIRAYEMVKA
ncbi:hypothetical protein CBR_g19894 [Chara braunii]|uniref:Integrase catalytic domain-containing protein n=1 Tax=Chara braunii TaxID=69332 RepID=A0A388KYX4_CHABU|nr:hypothetical protein CBR_g19894 [Chara braunii]|eukprot:GBG75260.1 hypothetical protein CBR_g19894 [Chara braunii]